MKLKIKFWDTERKFFLESPISCVTAFRNYMDIPAETRFSDCPTQADKMRYIPVIHTGFNDFWDGDIVELSLGDFFNDSQKNGTYCKCLIYFDSKIGWWTIMPISPVAIFDGFPLFKSIPHLQKIGNKFENPELMPVAVS